MKPETGTEKTMYEPASIEIIRFEVEDILPESGTDDSGIDLPIDPFDP